MRISAFWTAMLRTARWHRRTLAALAAALATFLAITALAPPAPATREVLVTTASLPAGHRLQAADLREVGFPPALVPDDTLTSGDAVGEMLASPLTAGSPVTRASTVSSTLAAEAGEMLVPVVLANSGAIPLLHVGDRVTIVAAGQDGQSITVARRVRVAALPQAGTDGELAGPGTVPPIVVSADEKTATHLAGWSGHQGLGIAIG